MDHSRGRLQDLAESMARAERIHFLGERDDVRATLPHVDVSWQTGGLTGQPLSVLEAMACGTPVVASDTPCNRELITDRKTGRLFPPGEPPLLARCTMQLLENNEEANEYAKAAKQLANEKFSVVAMVQRHKELYERF